MISKYLKYITIALLLPFVGLAADNYKTETPGQKITKRGAEIFQREQFVAAFGDVLIDEWQINWQVLADANIPVTDPAKRNAMRLLSNRLDTLNEDDLSEDAECLVMSVYRLSRQYKLLHQNRLDDVVHSYFADLFPEATIQSKIKLKGVQMGSILEVQMPDGQQRKYYVKTHSNGRLSSQSTAAKRIDPGELLVYKLLEQIVSLDLVMRIAKLCDLINNSENFGFIRSGGDSWQARLLDFRLKDVPASGEKNEDFQSFLRGNGVFQYRMSHRSLCFSLCDRSTAGRVETALGILTQGCLQDFTAIEDEDAEKSGPLWRSYEQVRKFFQQECFSDEQEELQEQLSSFYEMCADTYTHLVKSLQSWQSVN